MERRATRMGHFKLVVPYYELPAIIRETCGRGKHRQVRCASFRYREVVAGLRVI